MDAGQRSQAHPLTLHLFVQAVLLTLSLFAEQATKRVKQGMAAASSATIAEGTATMQLCRDCSSKASAEDE